MEPKERKQVVLYCNGEVTWCYEDEIIDPPEPPREKNIANNEEESDN